MTVTVCGGYGNLFSVCAFVPPFVSCRCECHSPDTKTYLNPYSCTLCLLKTFTDILSALSSTTFHQIYDRKNNSEEYFFSLSVVGKRKPERKELFFRLNHLDVVLCFLALKSIHFGVKFLSFLYWVRINET